MKTFGERGSNNKERERERYIKREREGEREIWKEKKILRNMERKQEKE